VAETSEFWDDLLAYIKDGVLVPVIGPQLLVIDADRPGQKLFEAVAERLAARYQLALPAGTNSLSDAVSAVLQARGRDESQRLYRVVNDIITSLSGRVPEALRKLAEISDLRVFMSTSPDRLLIQALNDVRFPDQARTREAWFSPNQSTAEQQRNARAPGEDEVVVFRLFGQACSTPQYAIHDEDHLEWLHALLSDAARLPEWLAYRLKDQPLLFIGCDVPDWLGRFIVRMSSNSRLSMSTKQFFFVEPTKEFDPSLSQFFATYCGRTSVRLIDLDPVAFVNELHARWTASRPAAPAKVVGESVDPGAAQGSIFISYVREDGDAARRLAEAISRLGGDVWLDERRLEVGDRWEQSILSGIRRGVRLFVPMISARTEKRDEGYVFREWDEAVERARSIPRRRVIIPVVVDADYDGNPGRYLQIPEAFRQFHFGRAPGGEPDVDLVTALTTEIRAMRRPEAV
jgi:hypothetical protein